MESDSTRSAAHSGASSGATGSSSAGSASSAGRLSAASEASLSEAADRAKVGAAARDGRTRHAGGVLGEVASQVGGPAEATPACDVTIEAPAEEAFPQAAPFNPTPPEAGFMQGLREAAAVAVGATVGAAQAAGGFVADLAGGVAATAETAYEATVTGLEAATGLLPDDHAAQQRADLGARADGLMAAAREVIDDPAAVAQAFAESYEARFAQADALEAAYRSGHADLSALQDAARVRAEAETELGILGVETAAVVVGAGALAKGLRAAKIADRLDGATPLAMAMATTERARAATDAIADLTAEPGRTKPFTSDDVEQRTGARLAINDGFDALASERARRGLPAAGAPDDTSTMARIVVGDDEFFGVNRRDQAPTTAVTLDRVNAQTRTHAEADVAQQVLDAVGPRQGGTIEMFVDRDPCRACGANGGLRSLARNLGVDELVVHSPSGTQTFTPTR